MEKVWHSDKTGVYELLEDERYGSEMLLGTSMLAKVTIAVGGAEEREELETLVEQKAEGN